MKNTETFKTKSEESLKAAQTLINKKCFNSSVHCSYYACVQLLNYILAYSDDLAVQALRSQLPAIDAEEEQDENSEASNKAQNSHKILISNFYKLLLGLKSAQQYGAYTARDFDKDIMGLKKYRHKADYTEQTISEERAGMCYKTASEIITNLKKHYQIE